VKRIMALPNDILEMKSGRPYVNGWKVPSCPLGTVTLDEVTGDLEVEFLGDASYLVFYDASHPPALHAGPLYAAPDGVLVLGDDRNDSADSRVWHSGLDGNVHASALRGRALFVWLRESRADERHFGMDLDSIQLPSSLAAVKPALAACLASKPDATPPRSIRQ
jgi:signal peptidase I